MLESVCRRELTEDDVTRSELRSLCRDLLGRKRASIEQAKRVNLLLSVRSRIKLLTIEVNSAARLICQARGEANRMANDRERSILRRWATQAGLKLAHHV